jgi:predicted nucleic acid-binding protein
MAPVNERPLARCPPAHARGTDAIVQGRSDDRAARCSRTGALAASARSRLLDAAETEALPVTRLRASGHNGHDEEPVPCSREGAPFGGRGRCRTQGSACRHPPPRKACRSDCSGGGRASSAQAWPAAHASRGRRLARERDPGGRNDRGLTVERSRLLRRGGLAERPALTVVLDASVAVASLRPREPDHAAARAWVVWCLARNEPIVVPAIFDAEVMSGVVRGGADASVARALLAGFTNRRTIVLGPKAGAAVAALVARTKLRAADATYAWVALRHSLTLVTLDTEISARAGAMITVRAP